MSKRSKNCKKLLSFIDHTREWLADYPRRQARRSRHPRPRSESDRGVWHFHRKYAECGADAYSEGGVKKKSNKNVVPYRTFTTSVFDKGQQFFVRKILNFVCKCVIPIISLDISLDNNNAKCNINIFTIYS